MPARNHLSKEELIGSSSPFTFLEKRCLPFATPKDENHIQFCESNKGDETASEDTFISQPSFPVYPASLTPLLLASFGQLHWLLGVGAFFSRNCLKLQPLRRRTRQTHWAGVWVSTRLAPSCQPHKFPRMHTCVP